MADHFHLADVDAGYADRAVFNDLTLSLPSGRISVLVGPNGCGKSTALRLMRRLLKPSDGTIRLEQLDILRLSGRDLARRVALLTQSPSAPDELTVRQLVALGRFPHRRVFAGLGPADTKAVDTALRSCDLDGLSERPIGALSGGQRQRCWIAMVLAQDAPAILLDEPTNHLDMAHQLDCLELVSRLNQQLGRTVVLVMHDLNLAARYADHMVMLRDGKVVAEGTPAALMTEATIRDVFDIECRVFDDPIHLRPLCVPYAGTGEKSQLLGEEADAGRYRS